MQYGAISKVGMFEAQPRFWGSTPVLRLHRELGQALPFPTHPFSDEANNTGTNLSAQE